MEDGEKLPSRIRLKRGNRFEGDVAVWHECDRCGASYKPSHEACLHTMQIFARNDENNPDYRYGQSVSAKFVELSYRRDELLFHRNCRYDILNELRQEEKNQQRLEELELDHEKLLNGSAGLLGWNGPKIFTN